MHNDEISAAAHPLTENQKAVRRILEDACETVDPNFRDEIGDRELNAAARRIDALYASRRLQIYMKEHKGKKFPEIDYAVGMLKKWVRKFKKQYPAHQNWNAIESLVNETEEFIENV